MSPLIYVAGVILVWMAQPWVLQYWVIGSNSSRTTIFLAAVQFAMTSGYIGWKLQESLQDVSVRPICFLVLWYPLAMQFMRYLHALSVGGKAFAQHFGLATADLERAKIFMLCPPTVMFHTKKEDQIINKEPPLDRLKQDCYIALLDFVITGAICASVLFFGLDVYLPEMFQQIIRVYIMGFSTSILRLVEFPCRYWLRNDPRVARIIPIYDRPYLTTSPRELWRRWSVTAGYHLRKAFYDPLLEGSGGKDSSTNKDYTLRFLATAAPFFVNCVLHITWWSIAIKGEMDHVYWNLLFVYPLMSIAIQDYVVGDLIFGTREPQSKWHVLANMIILWFGFYAIGKPMASAHGLPLSLTDICRANIGLPPLLK